MENWKSLDFKGKVKSSKISFYKIFKVDGEFSKGELEWENTYVFNCNGDLIEKKFNSYTKGSLYQVENTVYWENEEPYIENEKWYYKYDDKGRRIEVKKVDNNKKDLNYKRIYKYNDNKSEVILCNNNGVILNKYVFHYDKIGNKINCLLYKEQNYNFIQIENYFYDKKHNLIKTYVSREINSLGILETILKYNSNQNKIEYICLNSNGEVRRSYTYEYDNKGSIIVENMLDSNGELEFKTSYKFEYDNQDNWIKEYDITHILRYSVTERSIEYY